MKTHRLISMTDFVLEQKQSESFNESTFINTELISLEKIRNYAKFLKQPLKLEMFVPCDEDGNVLEKPENYIEGYDDAYNDEIYNYLRAKEKVLFKGFKINGNYIYYGHFMVCLISEIELYTVESLLNHFIPETEEVQLTESALKQIGL